MTRGIDGAAALKALGDAVTGGRGTVTVDEKPSERGYVAWRSLIRPEEHGKHTTLVAHDAAARMNTRWRGLVAHWIDGCPCAACGRARGAK